MKKHMHFACLSMLILTLFSASTRAQGDQDFRNTDLDFETRADLLIEAMTLEEKAQQMLHNTPGIERLGIPAYDWWNEALHGVGRSGKATVFPQAIGMAATFDPELISEVSTVISDEARAMFKAFQQAHNYKRYTGLSFWTPNVNIFRDPRWGRGQETYGEDPYLTSALGVAFVKGLQGEHERYLKTAACAKHFVVHSGPEKLRHEFNAKTSLKDLNETYLPAFKALVEADVEAIMCAYNRTNDEPCCASNSLIQETLFDQWNFKGHVLSDCWALRDFFSENGHGTVETEEEAAALAVKSGVSLNCGSTYAALPKAVEQGLISEKEIDLQLKKLLITRFKLGLFDPPEMNPYNDIDQAEIDAEEHRALARKMAVNSMVLLKNNGVLPLATNLNRYYVVGPNAASIDALLGNYFGVNGRLVTFLEGITNAADIGSQVLYSPGTTLDRPNVNPVDWSTGEAADADVNIVVMGLTRHLEGEEGESVSSPYFGDRLDYDLPENQLDYLRKIKGEHGKPVVAIVTGGCPMNLSEVHELADAVLLAWYPGQEGGNAAADILFGKVSPSGRLPITFPKSLDQLPPYEDYSMAGRTYRFMEKEPMYPFGFGLSYAEFSYGQLELSQKRIGKNDQLELSFDLSNGSDLEAEEIVQVYVSLENKNSDNPLFSLRKTKRVQLAAGSTTRVVLTLSAEDFMSFDQEGKQDLIKGLANIYIGGSLPTNRSLELGAQKGLEAQIDIK